MTDSGSNDENRGRFSRQFQVYAGAAAATAALGSLQMTFSFPGWSFSFALTLVFTVSAFIAWVRSGK
tara:strand:+ start:2105 stop:2305 length:201 start_codon:yes stop_codon:yes gene_type:complete